VYSAWYISRAVAALSASGKDASHSRAYLGSVSAIQADTRFAGKVKASPVNEYSMAQLGNYLYFQLII
jgi:hypothetical protein